jgi:hypothetical protein
MKSIKQHDLRGCGVGITDGSGLWSTPLRWTQMAWYTYPIFYEVWFDHSSKIKVITSTIWEAAMLVFLMGGIYEEYRWDDLRRQDIHTRFHDYRFWLSSNIRVITSTIWEAPMLVLLRGGVYEACHWDGFRWHDIRTTFHDGRFRHLSNIKDITSTIWEAVLLALLTRGIY